MTLATRNKPSVAVATAASALAAPPTTWGYVDSAWNRSDRCPGQFELQVWGDASVAVTAATLYAGVPEAFTISATAATSASSATDLFTKAGHGLLTGDGPLQLTNSGGAVPGGLALLTNYWVVINDANTFKLATSLDNAMAATPITIDLTTNGTGTTTYTGTAAAARIHWLQRGTKLGPASDGAITLTASLGYTQRVNHDPFTVAYAVSATFTGAVSISARPIMEY